MGTATIVGIKAFSHTGRQNPLHQMQAIGSKTTVALGNEELVTTIELDYGSGQQVIVHWRHFLRFGVMMFYAYSFGSLRVLRYHVVNEHNSAGVGCSLKDTIRR